MNKFIALLILIIFISPGCASKYCKKNNTSIENNKSQDNLSIFDANWELIKIGSSTPKLSQEDEKISLSLAQEPMNYSGFSGCNRYFGSYSIKDSKISFKEAGMTLMACPDGDMNLEYKYVNILNKVESYSMKEDTLFFISRDRVVLTYLLGK